MGMMQNKTVKLKEIFEGIEVEYRSGIDGNTEVSDIIYNNKEVKPGVLFVCVRGTVFDGHTFAKTALEAGATAVVVDHELDASIPQAIVKDTRFALAKCAANFYDNPSKKLQLVGITGTNGKTTTSFLIEHIAEHMGKKSGVIGTVECRVGKEVYPTKITTPESRDLHQLFSLMVDANCEVCAMEVSSHAIYMGRLEGVHFDIGAFTNLSQDHLDFHKTMEEYFQTKLKLFTNYNLKKAVICTDSEYGKRVAEECVQNSNTEVLTVGMGADCNLRVTNVEYAPHSTCLQLAYDGHVVTIALPLVGRFNVENALVACGIGISLGYPFNEVCSALEDAPQVPGRIERVVGSHGTIPSFGVLVDYAHTPDAIENVIHSLRTVTKGRIICVFGCGGDRDKNKRPKMAHAALKADIAVLTTDNPRTEDPQAIIDDVLAGIEAVEQKKIKVQADRRKAIAHAIRIACPCDVVLIAGKGHEDYQEINGVKHHFDDREVAAEELEQL